MRCDMRVLFGAACGKVFTYTTAPILLPDLRLRPETQVMPRPGGDQLSGLHRCRFRSAMRLSKIKLAGFKSFVDPTSVNLDRKSVV